VSEPPVGWKPDRVKVECLEPEIFLEVDNSGEWGDSTLPAPNSTGKQKEKTSSGGNTPIMHYQLVQDQHLLDSVTAEPRFRYELGVHAESGLLYFMIE
jgi:hypothetical protein